MEADMAALGRWTRTKPSDDASLPPLTYWDRHGMLPRVMGGSAIVVYGRQGSHKTGLVLKMCLDAAFEKGAKVLYLAPEGAHGIMTARLPAACKERGKAVAELDECWATFSTAASLVSPPEIDELIHAMRLQGFHPDIISIDTMTRASGGCNINEPAAGTALMLGMERLGRAFDAAVIAVTHPGKDEGRGAIGSSLIENLAYAIWHVSLSGNGIFATVEKMKDGPADFTKAFKVLNPNEVPVIVDPTPGERLNQDAPDPVSEMVVRGALLACGAIRQDSGIPERQLVEAIAGHSPDDMTSDEYKAWIVHRRGVAEGLRLARQKRNWAKPMVREWCQDGATVPEWFWSLGHQESLMTLRAAPSPLEQKQPW